jgi:Anti-sigma-K factor rskA, C-terminal
MDHDETREHLELAAVEPGGLERLMAGDTAASQAVAAHLAGCPSCTDELVRLQRSATVARTVLREEPSPALRERTLASIRTMGVERPRPVAAQPAPAVVDAQPGSGRSRSWPALAGLTAIAAVVLVSVIATSLIVGSRVDGELADQARQIAALEHVTTTEMAVASEPDAEHVSLHGVADPDLGGRITYSPSTTELVVVAVGLAPPPEGQEYRCWIDVEGVRQGIGRMYFSDDLSFWAGDSEELAGLPADATFGISLVAPADSGLDAEAVLVGGG